MIFNRLIDSPSDWLVLLLWLALAVVMLWGLSKQTTVASGRRLVKLTLQVLLWIALGGLIWQPRWQTSNDQRRLLCYSEEVPSAFLKKVQDSLRIQESFASKAFLRKLLDNPAWEQKMGELYWVGQNFSPALLAKFQTPIMHWIPYFSENTLQKLSWEAVVERGNKQLVSGSIFLDEPQVIRLQMADKVLDSLKLPKGFSTFQLRFPAFALGKNVWQLSIGKQTLAAIHFFSFPSAKKHYLFLLGNPDFESKTLAEWLGRQGHSVEIQTQVAKNTAYKIAINGSKAQKFYDCIVTDAAQAGNALLKKQLEAGKSVLLINLTTPDKEVSQINRALGTSWILQRTSNQDQRVVESDLTALPYRFVNQPKQQLIFDEIALQKKHGKVGLSLLQETFGLMLSGDSLRYAKYWYNTFQALGSHTALEARIQAPLINGIPVQLSVSPSSSSAMLVEGDTVYTTKNPIIDAEQSGMYVPRTPSWQNWQDSLAIYVEENNSPLMKAMQMKNLLQAYEPSYSKKNEANLKNFQALPDELWYGLILFILTLLWLETKL